MTASAVEPRQLACRLVTIDSVSMRVLTVAGTSGSSLPRLSIPAEARITAALTGAIERHYGLSTIQLAFLHGSQETGCLAVHEVVSAVHSKQGALCPARLDEISTAELSCEERETVSRIVSGQARGLGRFSRLGWIGELIAKLPIRKDSQLRIRHVNQGIDFCLLSLTDGGGCKVWFKSVGEPNLREFALTQELARRFPVFLPKILASFPAWKGWLMEDVEGVPLHEAKSLRSCEQSLRALSIMQHEVAGEKQTFRALGAADWTYLQISRLFKPFFQDAQRAMQAPMPATVTPLTPGEMEQLQGEIESALYSFMNAGLPDTLLHGDIGHGNILVTPAGPVFLDWAETALGHPFLSAEHLLADLARSSPINTDAIGLLRCHYLALWRTGASEEEWKAAAALAPAMGAFVYAMRIWEANQARPDPARAWPVLRSMLRRTKKEMERAKERVA